MHFDGDKHGVLGHAAGREMVTVNVKEGELHSMKKGPYPREAA